MCRPRSQENVEKPITIGSLFMVKNQGEIDTSSTKPASKRITKTEKAVKKSRPIVVVQHNYHDYSSEEEMDYPFQQKSRGGVSTPFPLKLHEMLDKAMAEGYGDIVSWQPHGRCFVVYKPQDFQEIVLPKFFKLSKLSSFQRQLNLYGFQRLTFGRDRGGYYHERFLRHKEFLARGIKRVQVKGTGVRGRSNPDQEPNFWTMKWCDPKVNKNELKPVTSADEISRGLLNGWDSFFSSQGSLDWSGNKSSQSTNPTRNASFSFQVQSNPDLEPSNVFATGRCEPMNVASCDKNRGISSTWIAPSSWEDKSGQVTPPLPVPKAFEPIDAARQNYSTPFSLGVGDSNVIGSCGGAIKPEANVVSSFFGDKAYDNLDPLQIFEENTKLTNNGLTDSLYSRTFEQMI